MQTEAIQVLANRLGDHVRAFFAAEDKDALRPGERVVLKITKGQAGVQVQVTTFVPKRSPVVDVKLEAEDWEKIFQSRVTDSQKRILAHIQGHGQISPAKAIQLTKRGKRRGDIWDPSAINQRLSMMGLPYRVVHINRNVHRYSNKARWNLVRTHQLT